MRLVPGCEQHALCAGKRVAWRADQDPVCVLCTEAVQLVALVPERALGSEVGKMRRSSACIDPLSTEGGPWRLQSVVNPSMVAKSRKAVLAVLPVCVRHKTPDM